MPTDSSLPPDLEMFIEQQVSIGAFKDRDKALEAGVDLLRQRQALIDRLTESRRQLDEGEFVDFDDEGLDCFFELLLAKAEARSKSQ
jgi:Arc/MetJ-type ribon-helix-helix transcriptional regulator